MNHVDISVTREVFSCLTLHLRMNMLLSTMWKRRGLNLLMVRLMLYVFCTSDIAVKFSWIVSNEQGSDHY